MITSRKLSTSLPPVPITLDEQEIESLNTWGYFWAPNSAGQSISASVTRLGDCWVCCSGDFGSASSCETLRRFYVSYVRPHLEYADPLWDPSTHRRTLHTVQRFARRICLKTRNYSYKDMLLTLELPSLQNRRRYLKLCMLYKLYYNVS